MNPAYGRACAAEQDDDARETAGHGDLKQISVHPQKDGGFSVHAHYDHKQAGHHSVESQHASAEEAAEEVKRHLRGHEARRNGQSCAAGDTDDDSEN
jgi:hypothetical protein